MLSLSPLPPDECRSTARPNRGTLFRVKPVDLRDTPFCGTPIAGNRRIA